MDNMERWKGQREAATDPIIKRAEQGFAQLEELMARAELQDMAKHDEVVRAAERAKYGLVLPRKQVAFVIAGIVAAGGVAANIGKVVEFVVGRVS